MEHSSLHPDSLESGCSHGRGNLRSALAGSPVERTFDKKTVGYRGILHDIWTRGRSSHVQTLGNGINANVHIGIHLSGIVLRFDIDTCGYYAGRVAEPSFSSTVVDVAWDDFVRIVLASQHHISRCISHSSTPSACDGYVAPCRNCHFRAGSRTLLGLAILELFRIQDGAIGTPVYV